MQIEVQVQQLGKNSLTFVMIPTQNGLARQRRVFFLVIDISGIP
jgi:hypothetical protein